MSHIKPHANSQKDVILRVKRIVYLILTQTLSGISHKFLMNLSEALRLPSKPLVYGWKRETKNVPRRRRITPTDGVESGSLGCKSDEPVGGGGARVPRQVHRTVLDILDALLQQGECRRAREDDLRLGKMMKPNRHTGRL